MKINLTEKTIIYILCPAKIDTGGPTDLHQLAFLLKKKFKKKVMMCYYPANIINPVHKNYKNFCIPYANTIFDDPNNILILPETFHFIYLSKNYKKIQKILWWLSIDNFLKHWFENNNNFLLKNLIKTPFKIIKLFHSITKYYFGNMTIHKFLKIIYLKFYKINIFKIKNIKLNLSHSNYQKKILKSKNVNARILGDYIRNEYFIARKKISLNDKKNYICYNPSKCTFFFKEFMKRNKDLNFLPLKNFNLRQMIKIMSETKIYVDFGFHPGQDHLPREAAILKNCVITNKEGSAALYSDVPIKNEFKFDENYQNFSKIRKKIDCIFNNFPSELKKFNNYYKFIKNQESIFIKKASLIFN